MTNRLLPTALVLAFAATLFTLGVIAFDTLDADRYVGESRATQAKIREESYRRRVAEKLRDAELFYGDLRIMHERRLRELEAQPRTKKDGAGNDSLVTDSGGAAGASDGDRKGDGYRHTKGAGMKEEAVYRVPPAEVHRASSFRTPESVASESVSSLAATATDTLPCRVKTCTPPPTWRSVRSIPPLDAPLRFGSADGRGMWTWLKAGESSTPCTATEEARLRRISTEHADSYRRACNAKIGEAFLQTLQFQLPRATRTSASLSLLQAEARPDYTAGVVTDIGRTCIGEHDLIRPLLAGQRCPGTTYAQPYTTYVAVWSPRQSVQRCVCINFGNPPTKTRFYGEHRVDEWLLLPVPTSVRLLRDGSPSPDRFIEVKAFPLSRSCWPCMAAGEGEILLSRVDINLLPQIGWGGGVWP